MPESPQRGRDVEDAVAPGNRIFKVCFKRSVEFNRILLRFDEDVFVISNLFGIQGR